MLACTALAAVGVASFVMLAPTLNQRFARNDELPSTPPIAVIALSSSVESDGQLDEYALERLRSAAALTKAFPDTRLLTTRVRHPETGVMSDLGQRATLRKMGFPLEHWTVLSGDVFSTRDEALLLRSYVSDTTGSVVVVTSVSHSRRACATFERIGYTVACRVASGQKRSPLKHAYDFLYERAATVLYRHRDWIR